MILKLHMSQKNVFCSVDNMAECDKFNEEKLEHDFALVS